MYRLLIFIFLFANFIIPQNNNSNFEFSGITEFWKIIATLESNKEPSNSEWNDLFKTPGYKILTSGEFSKQFFIENFKLVFMPSKKSQLNEALKSGRNLNHLNHYIKVKDNKKLIDEQLTKLKRNNISNEAVKKTLQFLPQSNVDQYPPVSFVIFESNGRGSSPIVVDLAASMEWDLLNFLSHEFHHWYRNRQLQYDIYKIDENDEDLINALAKIEAEGIADMVDKKEWFTKSSNAISSYARQYIDDVGKTPYIIKKIDALLLELSKSKINSKQIGKRVLQSLPQQGHTTGYFMASLILEKIGKNELVKCVGNPFGFIKLYNLAAIKSNGRYPSFSDEAIKVINGLEEKLKK
ncbi:MAG: hypothetical protein IPH62_14065 [Ignavibacteriae bacterium]|nr:hypothetical protein [Ignavibacteriota bacterium]